MLAGRGRGRVQVHRLGPALLPTTWPAPARKPPRESFPVFLPDPATLSQTVECR
jgi:hypothetical protein